MNIHLLELNVNNEVPALPLIDKRRHWPGKFGVKPTQRLLTLTTCNPEYSASQRMIVTAEMATPPTAVAS